MRKNRFTQSSQRRTPITVGEILNLGIGPYGVSVSRTDAFSAAFFDHFAVGGEGLLGILRATGSAVCLAELEIVSRGRAEVFCNFEVGDGAFDITLLEERGLTRKCATSYLAWS